MIFPRSDFDPFRDDKTRQKPNPELADQAGYGFFQEPLFLRAAGADGGQKLPEIVGAHPDPVVRETDAAFVRTGVDVDPARVLSVAVLTAADAVVAVLNELADENLFLRIERVRQDPHQAVEVERHLVVVEYRGRWSGRCGRRLFLGYRGFPILAGNSGCWLGIRFAGVGWDGRYST